MKKSLTLFGAMIMTAMTCLAQSDNDVKLFEETGSRDFEPQLKVYVTPQVCDVKYLSASRQEFGPYKFEIKGSLDEVTFLNLKNRAVYLAMKEFKADAILAMVPHSYISEENDKVLVIEISGYPVKYVNFRPLNAPDVDSDIIIKAYPQGEIDANSLLIPQPKLKK